MTSKKVEALQNAPLPLRLKTPQVIPFPHEEPAIARRAFRILRQKDFDLCFNHPEDPVVLSLAEREYLSYIIAEEIFLSRKDLQLPGPIRAHFYWDDEEDHVAGSSAKNLEEYGIWLNAYVWHESPMHSRMLEFLRFVVSHEVAHLYVLLRYPGVRGHYKRNKKLEEAFCDGFAEKRALQRRRELRRSTRIR